MFRTRPKDHTPELITKAGTWMHSYACKLPARDNPEPHPPDPFVCAQFLSIAPWPRLERLIYDLMAERQPCGYSYACFVSVALQRLHGIHPNQLKAQRDAIKLASKKSAVVSDRDFADDLTRAITAQVKRIR